MTTPRHAELEAAIAAAPADAERWLVYADWLQQQGAPRGELIRLDVELARTTDDARRAELLAHTDALARTLPFDAALGAGARRTFGFVTTAAVGYSVDDFVPEHASDALAGDLARLGPLLADDDARYVTELVLQTTGDGDWRSALGLVRASAPASLERLTLYARQSAELPGGDVLPTSLRVLRLEAGQLGAEPLRAPDLSVLDVEAAGFEPSVTDALAASELPALKTFRLSARYTPLAPALRPLLSARWPVLEHLALHGLVLWPEDLKAFARSRVVRGLTSFDLSSSAFPEPSSDGVVTGLVAVARAAPALKRLDVSGCQMPPSSVRALRATLPGVRVEAESR